MKTKEKFWNSSIFHALIAATVTYLFCELVISFVLEKDNEQRKYIISGIITLATAFLSYVSSLIYKLIRLLKSKENIIEKIDEFVDDRIRRFYKDIIHHLSKYHHFSDFIIEVTNDMVFKNTLPTLAEIENSDYYDIIKKGLFYSHQKSFNATLTGSFLPHWFFNNEGGMTSTMKLHYLSEVNDLMYKKSKRLMIFDEQSLQNSFKKINSVQKKKFLSYHEKIDLFWISTDNFVELTGFDMYCKILPDCALIDNEIGLEKQGTTLKIIIGDRVKPLIDIFKKLDEHIHCKSIDKDDCLFKTKKYISENFKANDE